MFDSILIDVTLTVLGIGTRLVASFVDAEEEKPRRKRGRGIRTRYVCYRRLTVGLGKPNDSIGDRIYN